MQPDDDTPPPRPRWLGWALIAFGLLITLGMLNLGVRMVLTAKPPQAEAPGAAAPGAAAPQPPASANPTAPTVPAAGASGAAVAPQTTSLAGQALVEASDCLRCHGMDRRYVGPSFRQIAARYQDRPDAAAYLANVERLRGELGEAEGEAAEAWQLAGDDVAMVIGGPDGLEPAFRQGVADERQAQYVDAEVRQRRHTEAGRGRARDDAERAAAAPARPRRRA